MTLYVNQIEQDEARASYEEIRRREKELTAIIPPPLNEMFKCMKTLQLQNARHTAQLNILYYELQGVKGVDYTREKGSFNQDAKTEKYYQISDRIKELEGEQEYITACISTLNKLKSRIRKKEIQDAITEMYYYKFL